MMTVGDFWNRYGLSRVSPGFRSQIPARPPPCDAGSGGAPGAPLLRRDARGVLGVVAARIEDQRRPDRRQRL